MVEPVHDWDKVLHKNVRCEDNQSVGNIVAVDNGHIIVTSQGGMNRYRIPKSFVESYNGAKVILKLPRIALRCESTFQPSVATRQTANDSLT